ncbi:MAG: LysM peptidoglycan-binding domain-containing protein [Chloroflexi bacterium]|nr:LysM peptidoglycan-binding domain-containing protein [Chloroflexota bacterium]
MRRILFAVMIVLALVVLTHATTGTTLAAGPKYHVVQPGQTLTSIAGAYGMSTWSIAYANGVWNPNLIYVGQVLVIPYPGYDYGYYPRPYYPVVYYPKPTVGCFYWVKYGDTMLAIAGRFRGDAWTIARANGIYNLNWIYAGQRLFIPGCK